MTRRELPAGTLTFLFTDIEGSTRLLQDLPHAYPAIVEAQRRIIRESVAASGGLEFGTEGDAVFAVFTDASSALAAAGDAQRALLGHAWPAGASPRVRMGVHTGEAIVVDDDYVGLALHVAARVCSAAHGGQVLVSEASFQLVEDVATIDHGPHRLRDVVEPMRIYALAVPGLPLDLPPLRTLTALPNNLPVPTDAFVGRTLEVLELVDQLRHHRLVTVYGAGGIGKTRLALDVTAGLLTDFRDGVWFVDLSVVSTPEQVLPALASVLRIGERSTEPLDVTVAAQLRARELLLVLDNCEHVVDRAAGVVDRLLRECSDVKVLATSRELLRVRGEQAFPVPQFDEAVELFAVRARSAVPGFDVDAAGRDTVEQICAQLDRLPLAIELAAARLRSLSVRQIADRLDDRFRLLTTGDRTSDPRRQTLEAVVAWSYDLLDEIERAVFRRVAVLVDSFGLDAAEQIAGWGDVSPAEVLDVIARLADKSLLTTKAAADGYRYALLETLRHYGRRRLEASGEGPATRAHLVEWAVGWAERLEAVMRTPAQDELIAASLAERANIRAAFVCAAATDQYVTALRIAAAIPIMLTPERRDAIEQLLVKASDADDRERAFALMAVSNLSFELGDWDRGRASAAEAARNFARTGNARLEAWANWFVILGDWESGGPTFRAGALALVDAFTALDDELGLAYALWAKSFATEDLAEADACAARADALFRRLGSPVGLGHTIEGRALLALRFDDVARAQPFLVEALAVFAGAQNVGCTAHVLEAVAAWLVAAGDEDEAGVMLGAAEELRRAVGQARRPWEREGHTRTEVRLGGRPGLESARARGRALAFDEAVRRAEAALDLVRERE